MPVSKLLKFPYGSYLIVRLDYVIICGDELEAKIMRLIEMYMDDERKILYKELLNDPKNDIKAEDLTEITKDVWAAISHRLFMNDLYHLVKSENTLKRALKSLRDKNFIRIRDKNLKQYEAPKYQINTSVVQGELDKLAKVGKAGYQRLIPSTADTIKNSSHQTVTPSEDQRLIPSSDFMVSTADTNSRRDYDSVENTVKGSTYGDFADRSSPTPALSSQNDVVISGHDPQAPHLDVNCTLWRRMNGGTCQDYQAAIDSLLDAPAKEEPYEPNWLAVEHAPQATPASIERGAEATSEHQALHKRVDEQLEVVEDVRRATSREDSYSHETPASTYRSDGKDEQSASQPPESVSAGSSGYTQRAQMSTPAASSSPASAKVEPRRSVVQSVLTATPKPLTTKAHTNLAFTWLDAVRKEATGDPMVSYVANGANRKRIADLIEACKNTTNEVSEINVRLAWLAMWNAGTWKNGKSWQDPGMLTVNAFCEHYGDYLDQARKKPRKPPKTDTPAPTGSTIEQLRTQQQRYAALGGK